MTVKEVAFLYPFNAYTDRTYKSYMRHRVCFIYQLNNLTPSKLIFYSLNAQFIQRYKTNGLKIEREKNT